jgi:hypothetical protein
MLKRCKKPKGGRILVINMVAPLAKKEVESAVKSEAPTLEFKTLKDINWTTYTMENGELLEAKFSDIIRQEAIKWVKSGEYDYPDILIRFCNLTEEDLK